MGKNILAAATDIASFEKNGPDIEAEAQRQKTALLFRNSGIAQSVNVVNASLLAYVNALNHASSGSALLWWSLVVVIAAGRYLLARRFLLAMPDAAAAVAWRSRYIFATALMGAAWGAGTVVFMWKAPDGAQLFTGLVFSGMVAGAVPLLASVPTALRTFVALVNIPMSAVILLQAKTPLHWAFGSMSLIFLAAVLASARYLHETIDVSIRLGLEQGDLVKNLEQARTAAEASLSELEKLTESQRLLKAAVEQSSASIVVTDTDARIIFANAAFTQITGYSVEEALGRNPRILKSGRTKPETYRDLWETLVSGRAWHHELCNRKKDGELFWEAANISPIMDAQGRISHYLGVMDDITDRKHAEAEILRLSQWNELLLNSAGEGIYGVEQDGAVTFINPAALAILGLEKDEVLGRNAHQLMHHHHQDGSPYLEEDCPIHLTRQDGIRRQVEEVYFRRDGEPFPVQMTVTPMQGDGQLMGVEVVFQDISSRKKMEQDLVRLATTDPLTGVANRRRFLEQMEMEWARVRRFGTLASLLMVDVDYFKKINDAHGHAIGDEVLRHLADLSVAQLRRLDLFGRLGGEEFGILLPGTDGAGALQVAEEFRRNVANSPLQTNEGTVPFSISIGATAFERSDRLPDQILARADAALYRAKEGGRNRVEAN
ncbi:MAG: PAS domain S-box protein [Holophagaceae bacterium]|nr:PAS domain S-box protein [Holophagaceae bacterium]